MIRYQKLQLEYENNKKHNSDFYIDNFNNLKHKDQRPSNPAPINIQKLLLKQNSLVSKSISDQIQSKPKGQQYFSDKALFNVQRLDQEIKKNTQNKKIMRVIKGGGKKKESPAAPEKSEKKFFFEKLISSKNIQIINEIERAPLSNRRDYEKLIQEKYENQMKLLSRGNEEVDDDDENSHGFNSEDD